MITSAFINKGRLLKSDFIYWWRNKSEILILIFYPWVLLAVFYYKGIRK